MYVCVYISLYSLQRSSFPGRISDERPVRRGRPGSKIGSADINSGNKTKRGQGAAGTRPNYLSDSDFGRRETPPRAVYSHDFSDRDNAS